MLVHESAFQGLTVNARMPWRGQSLRHIVNLVLGDAYNSPEMENHDLLIVKLNQTDGSLPTAISPMISILECHN